jgi:hypothetical protein
MSKRKSAIVVQKKPVKVKVTRVASPQLGASLTPCEPLYSVHPGVSMVQRWIAEMKVKTGRTLEEWVKHIQQAGPETEKQCREWLKAQYELGTNTAWWLAERAFGNTLGMADETPEKYLAAAPKYVEQMYAGPKQSLRALHDRIIEVGRSLGDDIRICPCKTIVPLYRRHVFAEIKPATQTRIDLGFALQDEPFTARLLDTGGPEKKNRITHKVAITKLTDIDLQVRRWLKQAYELDA